MSSGSPRAQRLADRIKVVVAQSLEHRVKDPRLGFVTITDCRVTGDLQHATVFYTVLGGEEDRVASAAALQSAKGRLRSEVGKAVGTRITPSLEFVLDALPESAASIDDLLRQAREQDAAVAALAAQGRYAGEADPYKHPDDEAGPDPAADPVKDPDGASG